MPIPKKDQAKYGKIVGHLQNEGYSPATARKKADQAIKDSRKKKSK